MTEEEKQEPKPSLMRFSSGQPMQLIDSEEGIPDTMTAIQKEIVHAVLTTVLEYLRSAHELAEGKYAHLKQFIPRHLLESGLVVAACCEDGVIIRYDAKGEDERTGAAWSPDSLIDIAPKFSESVVYCHTSKDFISEIPQNGPILRFVAIDGKTGQQTVFSSARIGCHVILERPTLSIPPPPSKPYCVVSLRNSLEVELLGQMMPGEYSGPQTKSFLMRGHMRLPVGWACIEVFPFIDKEYWKPENARFWAENDILASVVAAQFRESQLRTLDPNAVARKEFGNLLKSYKDLLDSEPEREEVLQSFLKENPVLLCPTYIMVRPKLPIGAKVTDFVFQEASGEYLLVELEPSTDRLFIQNGDTSSKLNHAKDQITDWRRYIEDNLLTVQHELNLPGISSNPKGIIVMGRSHTLTEENKRKLVTLENETPRTKILTYDDVLTNTKVLIENFLGPIWLESGDTEIYYLPQESQESGL